MPKACETRSGKVTFLRTPYDQGLRLEIPPKLKYSNIIDPASLPVCVVPENTTKTEPDPEVYIMPDSYWPSENAEIVSPNLSAEEVWNLCRREQRCRPKAEHIIKKKDTSVNNTSDEAVQSVNISVSYTAEIEAALQKLERLPKLCRDDVIKDMKPDFSEEDYQVIRSESHRRFRNYIDMIKKTFGDRELDDPPDTEDPRVLTRELKHRLNQSNNFGCTAANSTSNRRRKQQFPRRANKI